VSLRIFRPGLFTTVQDLGRPGLGAIGVPASGAMDSFALRAANLLVGNHEGAAGLEFTLSGPEISFEEDVAVALVGSRFECKLSGNEVPHEEAFLARAGDILGVGRTLEGARGYLAVGGGITMPPVLGSLSTFPAGGFGGLDGRALRTGDELSTGEPSETTRLRRLERGLRIGYRREATLRVVPGPQEDRFTKAGRETFYRSEYRVSSRSDRIGVRLEGAAVARVSEADLDPEGLVAGAIQIPADGRPILLANDQPTTGGYTKIATVISVDLSVLAQVKPGDSIRFVAVGVEEARRLWRDREDWLRSALEDLR
jgi:antagonist of KipI